MTAKNSPTKRTTSKYTKGGPLILKLSSGEELLVTNAKVSKGKMVIYNPYYIVRVLSEAKTNYQLDKWLPFAASDIFEIDLNNIITYTVPSSELIAFYTHAIIADSQQDTTYGQYDDDSPHQIH
jgi:hypothetical protein